MRSLFEEKLKVPIFNFCENRCGHLFEKKTRDLLLGMGEIGHDNF